MIYYFSFIVSIFLFHAGICQYPLRVNTQLSPSFLVKKILLNDENNLSVSNISYTGNPNSLGAFSNSSRYYIIRRGLILSTGRAEEAMGPNQKPDMGTSMGTDGSAALNKIATGKTYDASELSFHFIPKSDSLRFNFIFASEEYPEFVDKGVNDLFAFFLEDLSTGLIKNLAVVGQEEFEVNVDNINAFRNSTKYIENGIWNPEDILKWESDPGLGELALTYEFDGFTDRLVAGCEVIPGNQYKITFVIADVGDRIYDSAVFLEAESFASIISPKGPLLSQVRNEFINEIENGDVELRKGESSMILSLIVNFEFDKYEVTADSSLKILNKISRFMKLHDGMNINITGHTDNYGSEEYNKELSIKRAEFAFEYLFNSGLDSSRISAQGMGEAMSIAENVTKRGRLRNRRIDFEFYYLK